MKKWSELDRKEKTRNGILLVIVIFVFVLAFSVSGNDSSTQTSTISIVETQKFDALSDEEKLEAVIGEVLQGQNNIDKNYSRKIEVSGSEINGYIVDIDFNSDDNLTTNLRKLSVESTMSEIYTAVYNSKIKIDMVRVTAYFPLIDKYGNESDGIVYKSVLPSEEAAKVNWETSKATLELDILPGIWTTINLHPEFR